MNSDKIILNLYKSGFLQKAMKYLMDDYGDMVYRFILVMVKNEDDARDVSQEVFIKIYKKLHLFQGNSELKTWIFSVAKNTTYSYIQSRHYQLEKNDSVMMDSPAKTTEYFKDDTYLLRQNISELSDTLKIPLTMFYFMECRYEEIAHILDVPLNTIKAQIRRAKIQLLKKLKENKIERNSVS
ncbi:MAG: sigma-70 family RNA polymerase sigma factor [Candidatus Marinimicrobia bacterium]|nr:sigma-70 family RNA polymerase sigma factor [Candidatus Neomarinimicrobiota bacterium]